MHSPPVEWTLWIGTLAAVDWLRSRGEADNDTLSECVRNGVRRHPRGDLLFGVGVYVGAELLRRHIVGRP